MKLITITLVAFTLCVFACNRDRVATDRVTKVVVYHIPWALVTVNRRSCEDLAKGGDSVVIRDPGSIERLTLRLKSAILSPLPQIDGIDVRICCVFWGKHDTVQHTLSFSQPAVMALDGRVFERDRQLFEVVLSFLPKDYLKDWPVR
jgi:hypothetical protein